MINKPFALSALALISILNCQLSVLHAQITNAPAARFWHTAVWAGNEMIVWGGRGDGALFGDGARYGPVNNTWTAITNGGTPSARLLHTAVWTGTRLIVWGGKDNDPVSTYYKTGGRYNPANNTWTAMNTTTAPTQRSTHTAVWTGAAMIVWGGFGFNNSLGVNGFLNDGRRYNPANDTWTAINTTGAPSARRLHTAVWTGTEMIVWGGYDGSRLNTGARYNPATDTWTALPTIGAPSPRDDHTAVWTGSEMIVWGGGTSNGKLNDGGRYNPVSNSWAAVSLIDAPAARYLHTAVWSGNEMVIWGGVNSTNYWNDGGRYSPANDIWTGVNTSGAPSGRYNHTAIWTGSEMIAWGGSSIGGTSLNNGGRYNPSENSWMAVTDIPTLGIILGIVGNITISWTPPTPDYVLQETISLSLTNWANSLSAATNPVVVPVSGPTKFYRVIKP